jgi:hypothetical protein
LIATSIASVQKNSGSAPESTVEELQGERRSDPLIAKGNIIIEPPCIFVR